MKKITLLTFILMTISITMFSQEKDSSIFILNDDINELKDKIEGMNETILDLKSTVDELKKIKLSGYIQSQYQSIENDGASSFSGGNFSAGLHNRFLVRRGRLKAVYENKNSQYVLQIDATEKGLGLKDAYVYVKEPYLNIFAIKGGVFDRPFGFEISYSSSSRETPERSRLFQTLFPGERDLGLSLEITPTASFFNHFNFKGGFFAGNGINSETDNQKDFIGRFGFSIPFYEENFAIDGGISAYYGKVKLASGKYIYSVDSPSQPQKDSANIGWADRNYIGFDIQLFYDLPILGGFSLRGEYISGKQPGSSTSSSSPTSLQAGDIYLRNFYGYYINFIQNIGIKNQFVIKYDVYDPNSKVSADEVGKNISAKLNASDLKYSTLGIGLVHHFDSNVKFTFYYEQVKNETSTNLVGYNDDLKDNVFTFRIQYKF